MPYVPVPKDLTKVKTKVMFRLTRRQLICFSLAAAVGVPFYLLTRGAIGNDLAVFLMIALMLPFFFFALYEKDGQSFEKVLGQIIRVKFRYPAARPYQTNNLYAAMERHKNHEKEGKPFDQKQKTKRAAAKACGKRKKIQTGKGRH